MLRDRVEDLERDNVPAAAVRSAIRESIGADPPTLERVASALHVSPRTLQRQLAGEHHLRADARRASRRAARAWQALFDDGSTHPTDAPGSRSRMEPFTSRLAHDLPDRPWDMMSPRAFCSKYGHLVSGMREEEGFMRMDVGPVNGRSCPRKDSPAAGNGVVTRNCYRLLSAGFAVLLMLMLASTSADARSASARGARRSKAPTPVTITVLSSRADLVVGDEALVEVAVPAGQDPHEVTVDVGNEDETSAFSVQSSTTLVGLVTGLHDGPNTVTAQLAHGTGAQIVLTDHPSGGPVFAGPQVQPWTCEPEATDSQCDKAPTYQYLYRSTNPEKTQLEPYDPENPPNDVATTTANGVTVPFIVRVETGYQDRDQYSIAVLYNPEEPWSATSPQPQFAHKMLITHGFGCGVAYESATAPSTTEGSGTIVAGAGWALANGWTVMSTSLDNNIHNCDLVTQAESLLMAKERVIDRYGTLRYTVGTGCSGGSLTQQWVANAYPGIYQGILPTCSFPDAWSSATQVFDYHMLNHYFADKEEWGSGISWSEAEEAAVEGTPGTENSLVSDAGFFGAIVPSNPCPGTDEETLYNPDHQPGWRAMFDRGPRDKRLRCPRRIGMGPGGESARPWLRRDPGQQRRRPVRPRGVA